MDSKHTSKSTMTSISVASLEKACGESNLERNMTPAPEWTPSKQVKLIVLGQMFVVFAISLDMTILTATLPHVAEALNTNSVETFWVAASYLLANAVVQPLMAALADIFGRRGVIFTAMMFFTIGSIICCAANNIAAMLAGRTIQGIGGAMAYARSMLAFICSRCLGRGGILSVNLIIVSDLVPLRHRPKYISFQQLCVSVGFNIAPIVGGALVKVTTWRWLFYINLPFCAVGLAIIPFILKYQRPQSTVQDKLSSIDWVGSFSFIIGMTTFLIGITWGGSMYAWSSAATIVPLTLGLATVFMTGLYEKYLAKTHFLRLSLFSSWSAIAIYACTVLQALSIFTEVYFLVLYSLTVKLFTPLESGVYLLCFGLVCVPVSGIIGPLITRVGSYRWAVWSGWVVNTLALGILTLLDVHTPTFAWVLMFLTAGTGQGLLFIAHSVASQAACQQKDAAHASSMYSFMRSLGLCLGVALGGTIFQNFLQHRLIQLDLPVAIANNAEGFAHILKAMTDSPTKDTIVGAYAWSFQMLFAVLCGISGLGLLISCFIGGHSLDQELEAEHTLKEEAPADA